MKYSALILSPLFLFSCTSTSVKSSDDQHLTNALSFCYSLTGMAKMTVINKNNGLSLEEQQAKRKKIMAEGSQGYALINELTQKVYAEDLTNSVEVSINAHKSCLERKSVNVMYKADAVRHCPMQGGAIDMAYAARKSDFTKTDALKLINTNYPGFSDYFEQGYKKMIQDVYKGKMQDGKLHYADCMANNIQSKS